ncbi:MAG: twin-arginine translocase TatA/TatE family subunit [Candidatus Dormibacteria bacterium]|jgi:TatA/E family protein of Tat protein translocase
MERLFYLIPIVLIVVLLFGGASKLPEIGAATGRAIHEFRSAVSGGPDSAAPGPMNQPGSQASGFAQPGQWAPVPGDRPATTFPDDTVRP